ncbi:MAG: hypothetical protein ACR2GU_12185, partial [Rubrobacteraceae bacterium]
MVDVGFSRSNWSRKLAEIALHRLAYEPAQLLPGLLILLDAGVSQGDAAAIAARVREYLDAGADHVVAGMPMGSDFVTGVDQTRPTIAQRGTAARPGGNYPWSEPLTPDNLQSQLLWRLDVELHPDQGGEIVQSEKTPHQGVQ